MLSDPFVTGRLNVKLRHCMICAGAGAIETVGSAAVNEGHDNAEAAR